MIMNEDTYDFPKIHNAFRPRIMRYLARMVGKDEAEDLTQEVFVRVGQALKSFRGESALATWIYQIANNVAVDRLRRAAARPADADKLSITDIAASEAEKDVWTGAKKASTEQRVIHEEMNDCIRSVIDSLPETYRAVIVLSELEGFTDAEIAAILDVSLEAAKIRLHRARIRLKEELKNTCVFYRDDRNELACDRKDGLIHIRETLS